MLRPSVARRALLGISLLVPLAASHAQAWNDPRARALVERATQRRAQQLADTGLVDYQATAHGFLTFLAQMGEGFPEPPKVVKADELALQVYWRAPNQSKQWIVGRRDTTALPTDINYHRDHLGIVQNNFPDIIRLGEGDEVRDVPHPLSATGLQDYDYAITDSLRIGIPGRVIDVYEVKVRPRDDRQPRVVGALYLDRDDGQVVRMAFSFTRAAFLDRQLEDLSIVLENGLVGTRFWLPRRQEVEIRRTGTWLDYPVRGIIRGRWEISDYKLNPGNRYVSFTGPEIEQMPPSALKAYPFKGNILDSLPPDVRAVRDADVARVQEEARELVRAQALQRAQETRLRARGISDFASVNRVQGLTLGGGAEQGLGNGVSVAAQASYGIDEKLLRGEATLGWRGATGAFVQGFARRALDDMHDDVERSRVVNSLAAQEFGSDATEPYDVRAAGVRIGVPALGLRWTLTADLEQQHAAQVHASPAQGAYAPTVQALDIAHGKRLELQVERPATLAWGGVEMRASLRAHLLQREPFAEPCLSGAALACTDPGPSHGTLYRVAGVADLQRPVGRFRLVSHTIAAAANVGHAGAPPQELVYFGGPVSAPGYDMHGLPVATSGISQRVEVRAPVPFPAVPLGRFGKSPATATLAPFVQLIGLQPWAYARSCVTATSAQACAPGAGNAGTTVTQRGFAAVGVGLISVFDLLRLDVARGLQAGGRWTFSIDIGRDFWSIM
ncbi:MAG TPA: hypothetical protein VG818_01625 [Gemmatimonadaceae bacterium]|nr:hypothetical protein [Gemmatimonadaceae bacterium]